MDRLLKNYIAPFFYDVKEIKEIIDSLQEEFNIIGTNAEQSLNNMFILSTDEDGIARYEKITGIIPKGTDTLQDRQFNVLSKFQNKLPYTDEYLKNTISLLTNNDFEINIDNDNYEVTVKIGLSAQKQFDTINQLLKDVIPANMLISLNYLYNKYSKYEGLYTYGEMAEYTYKGLRERSDI